MGTEKWTEMVKALAGKKNTPITELAEQEKRQEQLVVRIYKLSNLLSNEELIPAAEEQLKLILEDALAELEMLNQQSKGTNFIQRHFH
jgi:hypothetical protein